MKVVIDKDACTGHGRCYSLAPEVFDPDDVGFGEVKDGGVVPEGLESKAEIAVANCPERAITIEP